MTLRIILYWQRDSQFRRELAYVVVSQFAELVWIRWIFQSKTPLLSMKNNDQSKTPVAALK